MEKTITLNGRSVTIRPLPYELWLELEDERDSIVDQVDETSEKSLRKITTAIQKFGRRREQVELAACVNDWEALRPQLSIRDVRELKRECVKLSDPEIESENLSPAVAGAATPDA